MAPNHQSGVLLSEACDVTRRSDMGRSLKEIKLAPGARPALPTLAPRRNTATA